MVSTRRNPPECLDPRIKSCNYLNNVLAKIEALEAKAQIAIMLDIQGFVSEECGKNIFSIKDSILYTPQPSKTLEGITRENIIEIAKAEGPHQPAKERLPGTEYNLRTREKNPQRQASRSSSPEPPLHSRGGHLQR